MMTQWCSNSLLDRMVRSASYAKIWKHLAQDIVFQLLSSERYVQLCKMMTKEQLQPFCEQGLCSPLIYERFENFFANTRSDGAFQELYDQTSRDVESQDPRHHLFMWPEHLDFLKKQAIDTHKKPIVADYYYSLFGEKLGEIDLTYWIEFGYHQTFIAATRYHSPNWVELLFKSILHGEVPISEFLLTQCGDLELEQKARAFECAFLSRESSMLSLLKDFFIHDFDLLQKRPFDLSFEEKAVLSQRVDMMEWVSKNVTQARNKEINCYGESVLIRESREFHMNSHWREKKKYHS